MKKYFTHPISLCLTVVMITAGACGLRAQDGAEINISHQAGFGMPPIPIALEGIDGEAAEVLHFDLYVQGFKFVSPDTAKFIIKGNGGGVGGTLTDAVGHNVLFARTYNGAGSRRLAHAFADDIVKTITHANGIGLTQIAFKSQGESGPGEIYIADFDGHNSQQVTHDDAIVADPSWVPGQMALFYNSYKLGFPDIFYQNLSTGQRRVFAKYGGSNISPAVSPDGTKVAMILSKGGSPDVYVCDIDGSNLRQLTHTPEDSSSPCWSPDSQTICFATKIHEHRVLAKISVNGGEIHPMEIVGGYSPSEPDWSPDGKYIAFTRQLRHFEICIVPAEGGNAIPLVNGQDPSWSPNSRTLIFNHDVHYRGVLSVLDVFTKQVKDISQVSGSNSEASWKR